MSRDLRAAQLARYQRFVLTSYCTCSHHEAIHVKVEGVPAPVVRCQGRTMLGLPCACVVFKPAVGR